MTDDITTTPGRVDFHHHYMPASMLTSGLFGATAGWKFRKDAASWTPQVSVEFMDKLQIDTAILSIPNDVESRILRGFVTLVKACWVASGAAT